MSLVHRLALTALRRTPSSLFIRSTANASNINVKDYPDYTAISTKNPGSHARLHWTVERVVAVGMLPLFPVSMYFGGTAFDILVITAVSLHGFWGLDSVIKDYAFPRRYGPTLQPVLRVIWKVLASASYGGFLYFIYTDIGLVGAIKSIWSI